MQTGIIWNIIMLMKKLIIIPTYNEKENITRLIPEILKLKIDTDILVVDDGSPDGTGEAVEKIARKNKHIKVMHRNGKLGLGSAYVQGFKYAIKQKYDLIFQMDADFSHQPKYLKSLIHESEKYDLVLGSRWVKGGGVTGWAWYRYVSSWSANLIARTLLSLKPRDITTGFRCYHRKVLETINLEGIVSAGYAFLEELIYRTQKAGFTIGETPIIFVDRTSGQSKMTMKEISTSAKAIFRLFFRRRGAKLILYFTICLALMIYLIYKFHIFDI